MNNSKKRIAFSMICERSNLYKTTLSTLLDSRHDDEITDKDSNISYLKLAKMVAEKRNTDSRFLDSTTEDRDVASHVVKDFMNFAGKILLDDIREENNILDEQIEVLKVASS